MTTTGQPARSVLPLPTALVVASVPVAFLGAIAEGNGKRPVAALVALIAVAMLICAVAVKLHDRRPRMSDVGMSAPDNTTTRKALTSGNVN
jgi:undecaprenyl pyrophosphate phosphatase UppP